VALMEFTIKHLDGNIETDVEGEGPVEAAEGFADFNNIKDGSVIKVIGDKFIYTYVVESEENGNSKEVREVQKIDRKTGEIVEVTDESDSNNENENGEKYSYINRIDYYVKKEGESEYKSIQADSSEEAARIYAYNEVLYEEVLTVKGKFMQEVISKVRLKIISDRGKPHNIGFEELSRNNRVDYFAFSEYDSNPKHLDTETSYSTAKSFAIQSKLNQNDVVTVLGKFDDEVVSQKHYEVQVEKDGDKTRKEVVRTNKKERKEFDSKKNEGKLQGSEFNPHRYSALNSIRGLYKFFSFIFLIGGIIGGVYAIDIIKQNIFAGYTLLFYAIIIGVVGFISSAFIAAGIRLFINISNDVKYIRDNFHKVVDEG